LTDVQVSLETGQGLERRLRVQVPAGRIDEEIETRLRSAGRTASIKGFRPGKVPTQVIRQRFGAQIRQEVLQDMVQSSYSEAIAREKLRPAGGPRIEAEALEAGKDLAYTAVFEVYPEFQVAGLERLAIDKPQTEVTESDVERTLESLRRQRGTWQSVAREAVMDDRVIVDFSGTLNGEPVEGGRADKLAIVIGEGRMLADFESNLVGMRAGDDRTFTIRFPQDYHAEKLRDQQVAFDVSAREVAELQLPPTDEDFVKSFGVGSGELGELRRLIGENLRREAEARIYAEVKRQILEQLLGANPIVLPAVLIAREAAGLQAESARNLGLKDVKDAPALSSYREIAERRVRLSLIMAALIREHGLKPDQEHVRRKLEELCRRYDQPEEIRKLYLQNPELMAQVEDSVMEDQVLSWLAGRAEIRTRPIPFAELMAR
jgi:trigger factor